jgi:4-hydroxybenzoate polyprenyltransferase
MANKIFAFLNLIRFFKPTGIALLYIPCAFGILIGSEKQNFPIYNLLIFFIGSFLMRSAGCIINDLWDRKIDAKIQRTKERPLVTGDVSTREAFIVLFILLFFSSLILFSLPQLAIKISICSIFLVITYPLMKRITFFPQLFLGITYNIGVIIGYVAESNSFNPNILFAYLGFIFWTLIYDTIYAFLDIEDDKKVGVKSLAIILEQKNSKLYFYFFGSIFLFLSIISEILIKPSYYIYMNIIPALIMFYLINSLEIKNKISVMKIFKNNSILGLSLLLVIIM